MQPAGQPIAADYMANEIQRQEHELKMLSKKVNILGNDVTAIIRKFDKLTRKLEELEK